MNASKPWVKNKSVHSVQRRKKSICVFTEGQTERIYFTDFGVTTAKIICLGGGGALRLASEARDYKKLAPYSEFDYYWLVFDKDNSSPDDILQAIHIAERSKISWCFSNPCFELWYILHFDYFQASTTAKDLKTRIIQSRIPGYTETMPGIYDLLQDKQEVAIKNSRRLWPQNERFSQAKQLYGTSPATNVDDLVDILNRLNK